MGPLGPAIKSEKLSLEKILSMSQHGTPGRTDGTVSQYIHI